MSIFLIITKVNKYISINAFNTTFIAKSSSLFVNIRISIDIEVKRSLSVNKGVNKVVTRLHPFLLPKIKVGCVF